MGWHVSSVVVIQLHHPRADCRIRDTLHWVMLEVIQSKRCAVDASRWIPLSTEGLALQDGFTCMLLGLLIARPSPKLCAYMVIAVTDVELV